MFVLIELKESQEVKRKKNIIFFKAPFSIFSSGTYFFDLCASSLKFFFSRHIKAKRR